MKKRYLLLLLVFSICLIGCGIDTKDNSQEQGSTNNNNNNNNVNNPGENNGSYVDNSKKFAYINTASAYVDAARIVVNMGADFRMYSTSVLYLIPVGSGTNSCVDVESGGESPYSGTWRYAYVGVIYNGAGYEYFFVAEDGSGTGLSFMTYKELTDNGSTHLYKTKADAGYSSVVEGKKVAMNDSLHDALVAAYKDRKNHSTSDGYKLSGSSDILKLVNRNEIKIYGKCKE